MKCICTTVAALLVSLGQLSATAYTTKASGNWFTSSNWVFSSNPILPLGTNDLVTISVGDSIYCSAVYKVMNKSAIDIKDNARLVLDQGVDAMNKLDVNVVSTGKLIVNGGVKANNTATITINGSAEITGTVTVHQGATISVVGSDAVLMVDGDLVATSTGNSIVGTGTLIVTGSIDPNFSVDNRLTVLSAPLPVELAHFSAEKIDGGNYQFYWTTKSETNNATFELLYSENGSDWEFLSEVTGAGNSSSQKEYTCSVDALFNFDVVYFRLKQISFTGDEGLSNIISLNNADNVSRGIVDTYPNPAVDYVVVDPHEQKILEMSVVDAQSRLVGLVKNPDKNKVKYSFDAEDHGVYYIHVKTDAGVNTQRIIVK